MPNVEQTSQELAEEQRRLAEFQRQSGQLINELQNIVKIHDQVAKINRQQNSELKRVQDLQTVSDVMNGNTDNKLSLERYVLQSYLTEVLQVANERLAKLTNGRYAFKLSNEAARGNGTKWSGLEINVYDDNAGQERSVRTLSGGESFIASLALALGLGEVIQERSGGIKVETLFIDEGFGSLDQEALEQAMNALQSIKGYQMIGIISHVTELENQIPNQLRVISRNGVSHVEYRQEISSLEN
ncbi:exonuclease SbcC [Limosilactobacillus coleohominis DSM 14060]|nr:exonuclease SbcC [Limosilactobacillus coleohominis DSM 14060]